MKIQNYFIGGFLILIGSCSKKQEAQTVLADYPPPPPSFVSPSVRAYAGPDQRVRNNSFIWLFGNITPEIPNANFTASWRQIGGANVNIEKPGAFFTSVSNVQVGLYKFELTARSGAQSTKDTVAIEVEDLAPRVIDVNNLLASASPAWDKITLQLDSIVINEIDYILIRHINNAGAVSEWKGVGYNLAPASGFWFTRETVNEITIWGDMIFTGHYELKIYY
jgi:hypothetical protein